MTSEEVQKKINELKAVRAETRMWRLGATGLIAIAVVACVWSLGSSVRNLFVPGPTQDKFTSTLTTGLKREVLPNVQTIATQALTESKPAIEVSFAKLNSKVPELTTSTMKQFDLLQKNIPARGDKVLSATYGAMLKSHEAKIREMFPEATEENVGALVNTMTTEGGNQIVAANDTLFSKHMKAMSAIQADLVKIQNSEPVTSDQDKASWEMALLVVDDFHQNLTGLKTADEKTSAKTSTGDKND